MGNIRVTKSSVLDNYWNKRWAGGLVRTYAPGNLLSTAAMSGGNPASTATVGGFQTPLAIYLPGFSQIGDPRSGAGSGSGYFNFTEQSQGFAGLAKALGAPSGNGSSTDQLNIGGSQYGAPTTIQQVGNSGVLLPVILVAFALWLFLK
jgi:hypothetical protein